MSESQSAYEVVIHRDDMLLHNIRDLPSRRNAVYVTVLTPFQSLSPLSKPEPVEILKFANVLVFAKAIFGPHWAMNKVVLDT